MFVDAFFSQRVLARTSQVATIKLRIDFLLPEKSGKEHELSSPFVLFRFDV